MSLKEGCRGQLVVVIVVRVHGTIMANELVTVFTIELVSGVTVDGTVLCTVNDLRSRCIRVAPQRNQCVLHRGLGASVLPLAQGAHVHLALLAIDLGWMPAYALLALPLALSDLLLVADGVRLEVRQILVQSPLLLAAHASGTGEAVHALIAERLLEA